MSKKASYEDQIEELEEIIRQIEDETIAVDELAAKVKRAAELIRKCRAVLQSTADEVDGILKDME
ncbi:MAG: exodeoxyribonuclease VII small subunit [Cryomorphaceae bacterium]